MTWVELLPKVLRCIQDAPGEGGYSPTKKFSVGTAHYWEPPIVQTGRP